MPDLGPLPKVHQRHFAMSKGRCQIGEAVGKAMADHELTIAETVSILANEIQRLAGHAVRDERGLPND